MNWNGVDVPEEFDGLEKGPRSSNRPKSAKRQIRRAIETKLSAHPFEFGKPLRYSLRGARRLRVHDHRVIYRIEPPDIVLVLKIGHRREVCEE